MSKLSKEDRLKYDHALKRYRDTLNAFVGVEQKGRAEGLAEGLAEERADIARNMTAEGMSIADITRYTGFTEEVILAL